MHSTHVTAAEEDLQERSDRFEDMKLGDPIAIIHTGVYAEIDAGKTADIDAGIECDDEDIKFHVVS